MGFFGKEKKETVDLSFVDKYVREISKFDLYMDDKEKDALHSSNQTEKLKALLDVLVREFDYWETFKETYPVAFFCTTPQRRFIEFNRVFEELTGWNEYELKNIDSAAKVLWPVNPKECKVCKIVKQYDMDEKKAGFGLAEIIDKKGEHIPVFVYVIPIFINGKLERTYVTLRDRRSELAQRKAYLEQIITPMDELKRISIKEWDSDDRPREKMLIKGKKSLSNAELIAIILGSGNREESAVELSKRLLNSVDNDLISL